MVPSASFLFSRDNIRGISCLHERNVGTQTERDTVHVLLGSNSAHPMQMARCFIDRTSHNLTYALH